MNLWKAVGLAGIAGVATVGVVMARRRRTWEETSPSELRDRLHDRLGRSADTGDESPGGPATGGG